LILPAPRHGLRALLEHHALHLGQELQVVVEADSLRLLVELVSRGLGHTMLPIWAVREEIRQERLVATSIKRGALRRESVLVWPNDRPLSPSAEAVAAALRKLARAQRRARA
jgi:LysR family nitrogen assimilation transcriptional regulator